MGNDPGAFLKIGRCSAASRPVETRIRDWKEISLPLTCAEIEGQAKRCLDCGIPFCHALGCPLSNIIPEMNSLVSEGRWKEAYERLEMTNPFPEITGRICPAPCECACTLAINDSAVSIKQIERAVGDRALEEGWCGSKAPLPENGKRVAVVGSGPAGLSAAYELRRMGFSVTVFERSSEPGGLLRYGIPNFKLEKHVLDKRIRLLEDTGIKFETDINIGKDVSGAHLKKRFDAVLLAVGAGRPRDLDVPGRSLEGIHFAMQYLSGAVNEKPAIDAKGKSVLIIGGGDTGSDCIGTARRQGAGQIWQIELMPSPLIWENTWNPEWPNWPAILRNTSSHEEGARREWSIMTEKFTGEGGRVTGAEFSRLKWKEGPGARKVPEKIPGSGFSLRVDLTILSMGFLHAEPGLLDDLGIKRDGSGNIDTQNYLTSAPGIFAAGDAVTGAALAVRAISQGRKAAYAVKDYLNAGGSF